MDANDPVAAGLREQSDLLRERCQAALALLEGSAARISAAVGGLRFSTLQKSHGPLISELRELAGRQPDAAVLAQMEALLRKIERLIAALASPQPRSAASEAGSAPPSPGASRQALIRGMITLAPAPLHLQIEFSPEFPLAEADPIILAARSHAINRAVLGSLRRIQWDAPTRYTLWFGDGEQRRVAAGGFDSQGKVDLPAKYRQNQAASPRPAPGSGGQRTVRQPGVRAGSEGAGGSDPGASRPSGSPPRRRSRNRTRSPAPAVSPVAGTSDLPPLESSMPDAGIMPPGSGHAGRGPGQPRDGGQRSQGRPANRGQARRPGGEGGSGERSPSGGRPGERSPSGGRPGERSPGANRPDERAAQGGRRQRDDRPPGGGKRDDRPQKPSGRSAFPANSMLADKLRAALSPRRDEPSKPEAAAPAPIPASRGDATAAAASTDGDTGRAPGAKQES